MQPFCLILEDAGTLKPETIASYPKNVKGTILRRIKRKLSPELTERDFFIVKIRKNWFYAYLFTMVFEGARKLFLLILGSKKEFLDNEVEILKRLFSDHTAKLTERLEVSFQDLDGFLPRVYSSLKQFSIVATVSETITIEVITEKPKEKVPISPKAIFEDIWFHDEDEDEDKDKDR